MNVTDLSLPRYLIRNKHPFARFEQAVTDLNQPDAKRQWVLAALDQYERRLARYAARLLGGDHDAAQDAVQHTFLMLCDQDPESIQDRLPAWLFTVCRNKIMDELRKQQRRPPMVDSTDVHIRSGDLGPAESAERQDLHGILRQVIDQMPTAQKEAVDLWSHGFSYEEISQITDRSNGAIRVLIHRAMTHLKGHAKVKQLRETLGPLGPSNRTRTGTASS